MQKADRVVAVSEFTKKRIIKYYGISPDKITVVHNAITFNEKDLKPKKIFFRKNKTPKVLFLGRLTGQKGPEYFLAAAHKILQSKKNVEFIFAGDGDMKNKLKRRATKLGINKKIKFTGFLKGSQVDKMYRASDIYVMPSVCEPFGIAPLEAMKNGTPCVVSKDAGVCEIIQNCLKINFRNVNGIAKEIIKLLESPELCKKLSINGIEEIKSFSWDKAAQKCIKVYKEICGGKNA